MYAHFAFLELSTPDLIFILAIVLLVFGGRKLPELSKELGQSIRQLRSGLFDTGSGATRAAVESDKKVFK